MSRLTLNTNTDQTKLLDEAVDELIHTINTYHRTVSIGLCGGRIAKTFYSKLVASFERILAPRDLAFFLIDERLDPTQRNGDMILEVFSPLLNKSVVQKNQFHFLEHDTTLKTATETLNAKMLNVSGTYCLDIAILSMGEDAHIASLFPNSSLLASTDEGYDATINAPKPPRERITLLPKTIQSADAVLLFVTGEQKKDSFERFLTYTKRTDTTPQENHTLNATFRPFKQRDYKQLPALLLHKNSTVSIYSTHPATKQ